MECVDVGSAELGDEGWMQWEMSSGAFILISLCFS